MNPTNLKQDNANLLRKLRGLFQSRRRRHDPWLVLNLLNFNSESGWNRIFKPVQTRENVWG